MLEGILDRLGAEDARGLADDETYRTVRRRTGPAADVAVYVNMEHVWSLVKTAAADKGPMVPRVLDALGLTGMKGLGMRMSLEPQGMSSQVFLYAPGEKKGLMKLMGGANSALVPPKFVPTGVASAMTMAFDWQGLWAEARRVMDEIKPGTTKQMDAGLASLKEQMGVDLEADLIGSLGKQITVYQLTPEVETGTDPNATPGGMGPMGMMNGRMVFAIEATDLDKINGVLDTLLQMSPIPVENRDYMGVTLRVMDMGMVQVGMATVAGHLVIATNLEDLRAIVQTQGKDVTGLSDTEAFKRALAGLPASRSMVTFSDPRQAMSTMTQMMQQMGPMLMRQNPEIADWIDLSLFPDAETLAKYMDLGGGVMVNEEDGVSFISFSRMRSAK